MALQWLCEVLVLGMEDISTDMKWFHNIKWCFGLTLWLRPHIEVWMCFKGLTRHTHPDQHVEVIPLCGWATFYRLGTVVESVKIGPRSWFRAFTIPDGWPHWFTLRCGPLVFVNVTSSKQSAAENIVYG